MVAALGIRQDGRKTILGIPKEPRRTPPWGRVAGRLDESRSGFRRAAIGMSWTAAKRFTRRVKKSCGRISADPTLPSAQATQRAGSSDRRTEAFVAKKLNAAYALEDYDAAQQALAHAAS